MRVLSELGVNLATDIPILEDSLEQIGIAFLYAPRLHPAMRHALPARKRLGIRTIFNLLGPLTNPAAVRRQIVGVPGPALTELLACVLGELGAERVWVVHGADGLCDLSITGPSRVTEWRDEKMQTTWVSPDDVGLSRSTLSELFVASPRESAATGHCRSIRTMHRAKLFSGNSNPALAQSVADYLDTPLGKAEVGTFSDGEVNVEIGENVRGMDCFVIQSTSSPANSHLMELLIMIDALRRSSAKRITAAPAACRPESARSSYRAG